MDLRKNRKEEVCPCKSTKGIARKVSTKKNLCPFLCPFEKPRKVTPVQPQRRGVALWLASPVNPQRRGVASWHRSQKRYPKGPRSFFLGETQKAHTCELRRKGVAFSEKVSPKSLGDILFQQVSFRHTAGAVAARNCLHRAPMEAARWGERWETRRAAVNWHKAPPQV